MEQFFITIGVAILLLMLATLFRVIHGPSAIDRILGVNVIGIKTTVLILIIGIIDGRVEMFIDITIAYALLNFITTIAAARFYQRQSQPTPVKTDETESAPSALLERPDKEG